MNYSTFQYGEDHLTSKLALSLAQDRGIVGKLSAQTRQRVRANSEVVENIASGHKPVYGINTGFGALCTTMISREQTALLQTNILKSHSVGVGEPIPDDIARLMLILKVHSLARGYSGIQEETLDRIIWHIDNDIIPIVPGQGSVGASGDLAPLSHLFLPLIGLGKVKYNGDEVETAEMLKMEGKAPLVLGPKEGLALINGTQFIAAHAVQVVSKLHNVLIHSDVIGAMMVEGLLGSLKPFAKELHELRPYKGNSHVASTIRMLLEGSEIMDSHASCQKVQDPYSLRCIPQVHGASRNAWMHLNELLEVELNAVTDNPIVFGEEHTISGGNFHGQPLAMPLDYACLAASELGSISDRRIYLSLEGNTDGVPKLLMKNLGINSGLMILQYTTAALASENKGMCFPSSADSIPTSLGQEDHVSMGSIGGRKALRVIENVEKILGIELLCAAQAIDFHQPLKSGILLRKIHTYIRQKVKHLDEDQVMSQDIETAIAMVKNGELLKLIPEIMEREEEFSKGSNSPVLALN